MSHEPPIPEAARTPYPIEEPPHPEVELPPQAAANDAEPASLKERAQELMDYVPNVDVDSRTLVGIGAAIAFGAAATVAAVLFSRRSPPAAPKKRAQAKPRATAKPSARKPATKKKAA